MRMGRYTHEESGSNLLTGLALIEAWARQDREAFEALLGSDEDELRSSVIGACRAAVSALCYVGRSELSVHAALDQVRRYGLHRRDELGSDPDINESNKET